MTTVSLGQLVPVPGQGRPSMSVVPPLAGARRLSARLDAMRRAAFIGRQEFLSEFDRSLLGGARRVLLVHGRRGLGKTLLLQEFARRARDSGRTVIELDGASGHAVDEQLRQQLLNPGSGVRGSATGTIQSPAVRGDAPPVVVIDNADQVEEWIRSEVLPQLPSSILFVMATAARPSPEWDIDPGWRGLVYRGTLPAFTLEEGVELLTQLGVDPAQREQLWRFADGHPLTLSALARHWTIEGRPDLADADLTDSLLVRLVGPVPDQTCGEALFVCAHAGTVTEDLLRYTLGQDDVSQAWDWLCSLGVVRRDPPGLRLNDMVRQLVETHLMRRSPDRCIALDLATHAYARERIVELMQAPRQCLGPVKILFSGHRGGALSRVWEAPEIARIWPRGAVPGDERQAIELIRRAGGESQAAAARGWLEGQPESLFVGDIGGEVVAAAMNVSISPLRARHCEDATVRAILGELEGAGLARQTDRVQLLRFVADEAGLIDSVAGTFVGLVAAVTSWLALEPSIAVAVGPFGRRWQQILTDLALTPLALTPLALGAGEHGPVFHFDFRRFPPQDWFEFLVGKGLRGASGPPRHLLRPMPLAYAQFAEAVQDALRDLHHLDKLAASPLVETELGNGPERRCGETLQTRLMAALSSIGDGEKDRVLGRVLEVSYLQGATSQKSAAKLLDLPFSTYRRYLAQGVQRLVDLLWAVEAACEDPA